MEQDYYSLTASWTLSGTVYAAGTGAGSLSAEQWRIANEVRESFRRDIENQVEPLRSASMASDRGAIDLAELIIKNATLLNGGAIIAIPAIVGLLGIDLRSDKWKFILIASIFASGLVSAWLANVFGFFALGFRSDALTLRAASLHARITRQWYPQHPDAPDWHKQDCTDGEKADRTFRQSGWLRCAGICLCFVSIAAFLSGGMYGGKVVLASAGTWPTPTTTDRR